MIQSWLSLFLSLSLPRSLTLTINLSWLSASCLLSFPYRLSHTHTHYQDNRGKIRRNERKWAKNEESEKQFLIIIGTLQNESFYHFLPNGDIVCVCVCACVCVFVPCEVNNSSVTRGREWFPLFSKGNKNYWYSYAKLFVFVSCCFFFFFRTFAPFLKLKWQNDSESCLLLKWHPACHNILW